jgi:homoserine kinase
MRVKVTVPATSANLGPGFDCFGLALDLRNEVVVDTEAGPGVWWEGEGAGELPVDGSDLVGKAMAHAARAGGAVLPALSRHGLNRIPLERGLGSSAAACVAGIALADALGELKLERDEMLELAGEIEGHRDNAAAAIAGGLTIAFDDGVIKLEPAPDLRPVILVPSDVRIPTVKAREALVREISLEDAVYNLGHAAAAVVALTSQPRLLPQVLGDRLHQEARLRLVPDVADLFASIRRSGVAVCVSGAGPSLIAFETDGQAVDDPGAGWTLIRPRVSPRGFDVSIER